MVPRVESTMTGFTILLLPCISTVVWFDSPNVEFPFWNISKYANYEILISRCSLYLCFRNNNSLILSVFVWQILGSSTLFIYVGIYIIWHCIIRKVNVSTVKVCISLLYVMMSWKYWFTERETFYKTLYNAVVNDF